MDKYSQIYAQFKAELDQANVAPWLKEEILEEGRRRIADSRQREEQKIRIRDEEKQQQKDRVQREEARKFADEHPFWSALGGLYKGFASLPAQAASIAGLGAETLGADDVALALQRYARDKKEAIEEVIPSPSTMAETGSYLPTLASALSTTAENIPLMTLTAGLGGILGKSAALKGAGAAKTLLLRDLPATLPMSLSEIAPSRLTRDELGNDALAKFSTGYSWLASVPHAMVETIGLNPAGFLTPKGAMKKSFTTALKQWLFDAIGEGGEEVAQGWIEDFHDNLHKTKGGSPVARALEAMAYASKDFLRPESWERFVGGFTTGALLGGGQRALAALSPLPTEAQPQQPITPQTTPALLPAPQTAAKAQEETETAMLGYQPEKTAAAQYSVQPDEIRNRLREILGAEQPTTETAMLGYQPGEDIAMLRYQPSAKEILYSPYLRELLGAYRIPYDEATKAARSKEAARLLLKHKGKKAGRASRALFYRSRKEAAEKAKHEKAMQKAEELRQQVWHEVLDEIRETFEIPAFVQIWQEERPDLIPEWVQTELKDIFETETNRRAVEAMPRIRAEEQAEYEVPPTAEETAAARAKNEGRRKSIIKARRELQRAEKQGQADIDEEQEIRRRIEQALQEEQTTRELATAARKGYSAMGKSPLAALRTQRAIDNMARIRAEEQAEYEVPPTAEETAATRVPNIKRAISPNQKIPAAFRAKGYSIPDRHLTAEYGRVPLQSEALATHEAETPSMEKMLRAKIDGIIEGRPETSSAPVAENVPHAEPEPQRDIRREHEQAEREERAKTFAGVASIRRKFNENIKPNTAKYGRELQQGDFYILENDAPKKMSGYIRRYTPAELPSLKGSGIKELLIGFARNVGKSGKTWWASYELSTGLGFDSFVHKTRRRAIEGFEQDFSARGKRYVKVMADYEAELADYTKTHPEPPPESKPLPEEKPKLKTKSYPKPVQAVAAIRQYFNKHIEPNAKSYDSKPRKDKFLVWTNYNRITGVSDAKVKNGYIRHYTAAEAPALKNSGLKELFIGFAPDRPGGISWYTYELSTGELMDEYASRGQRKAIERFERRLKKSAENNEYFTHYAKKIAHWEEKIAKLSNAETVQKPEPKPEQEPETQPAPEPAPNKENKYIRDLRTALIKEHRLTPELAAKTVGWFNVNIKPVREEKSENMLKHWIPLQFPVQEDTGDPENPVKITTIAGSVKCFTQKSMPRIRKFSPKDTELYLGVAYAPVDLTKRASTKIAVYEISSGRPITVPITDLAIDVDKLPFINMEQGRDWVERELDKKENEDALQNALALAKIFQEKAQNRAAETPSSKSAPEQPEQPKQPEQPDTSLLETTRRINDLATALEKFGIMETAMTNKQLAALPCMADVPIKQRQELFEAALVKFLEDNPSLKGDVKKLTELYNNIPTLGERTGSSMARQAYSTPLPLAAFLTNQLGDLQGRVIFEPTAGTGMFVSSLHPYYGGQHAEYSQLRLNELDAERRHILESLFHFNKKAEVSGDNAITMLMPEHGILIANPPFGRADNVKPIEIPMGKLKVRLESRDHIIIGRALEAMRPDGKAALIYGAPLKQGKEKSADRRAFETYLFNRYNVEMYFEVDGKLYRKQGASWPVVCVVINGKREFNPKKIIEPPTQFPRITSFAQLDEKNKKLYTNKGGLYDNSNGRPENNEPVPNVPTTPQPSDTQAGKPDGRSGTVLSGSEVVPQQRGQHGVDSGSSNERGQHTGENGGRVDNGEVRRGNGRNGESGKPTRPAANGSNVLTEKPTKDSTAVSKEIAKDLAEGEKKVIKQSPEADKIPNTEVLGDGKLQTEYKPRAKCAGSGGSFLTPVNLAAATQKALEDCEKANGDLTEFVSKNAGIDAAHVLYPPQVDAAALAITQMNKGSGMIIADQTGLGKGRMAATVISASLKKGHVPIFVTVKSTLFSDLYRDMEGIGKGALRPFIMNDATTMNNRDGEVIYKALSAPKRKAVYKKMLANDFSDFVGPKKKYDYIVFTYSQLQTEATGNRYEALDALLSKCPADMICDESHTAAGEYKNKTDLSKALSNTPVTITDIAAGSKEYDSRTFERMKELTDKAQSVTFLSATWAKRTAVLGLYQRVLFRDSDPLVSDTLLKTTKAGLQEILATTAARNGKFVRREQNMAGVKFTTEVITTTPKSIQKETTLSDDYNRELIPALDLLSKTLGDIDSFEKLYSDLIPDGYKIDFSDKKKEQDSMQKAGTDIASAFSFVHNWTNSLLSAIKAPQIVQKTKELLAQGKKVVISFDRTGESKLRDYLSVAGNKPANDIDIRHLLLAAIESHMRVMPLVSIVNPKDKMKIIIPFDRLPEKRQADFLRLSEKFTELTSLANLPASPIDFIESAFDRAGVKYGEITKRKIKLDYDAKGHSTFGTREAPNDKGLQSIVRNFNNGGLDVVLLNSSGSTGISLHSSKDFDDQKQRVMIIAEPMGDINQFMQVLGRINRVGQVNKPIYYYVSSSLKQEERVAIFLQSKMKSLNAQTTANSEGLQKVADIDIDNEYGAAVIERYLKAIDTPLAPNGQTIKEYLGLKKMTVASVTGRVGTLPQALQIHFWTTVLQNYEDLIADLDAAGINKLVIQDYSKADAKITEKVPMNPSAAPQKQYWSCKAEMTIVGKPVTMEQAKHQAEQGHNQVAENASELEAQMAEWNEAVRKTNERRAQDAPERAKAILNGTARVAENMAAVFRRAREIKIGDVWANELDLANTLGIIVDVKINKVKDASRANPMIASSIRIKLATPSRTGCTWVPLTKLMGWRRYEPSYSITSAWKQAYEESQTSRQRKTIITGNLIQALLTLKDLRQSDWDASQVINLGMADGTHQLVWLLPKTEEVKQTVEIVEMTDDIENKSFTSTDNNVVIKPRSSRDVDPTQPTVVLKKTQATKKLIKDEAVQKVLQEAGVDFHERRSSLLGPGTTPAFVLECPPLDKETRWQLLNKLLNIFRMVGYRFKKELKNRTGAYRQGTISELGKLAAKQIYKGFADINSAIAAGYHLLSTGLNKFAQWARRMSQTFGKTIHKFLRPLFADLQRVLNSRRGAAVNLPAEILKEYQYYKYVEQEKRKREDAEQRRQKIETERNKPFSERLRQYMPQFVDRTVKWATRKFVDHRLKLKELQGTVEKTQGAPLHDWENPYQTLELMQGAIQQKTNEFIKKRWEPIIKKLTDNGISKEDFNSYLYAKHAPERNAYIAEINPGFRNSGMPGSGMTDAEATATLKKLLQKYGESKLLEVGKMFWKMNRDLLGLQKDYGIIPPKVFWATRQQYKYYTPLKHIETDEDIINIGRRALGRVTKAEEMLAFAKGAIGATFSRGEHNRAYQALARLALKVDNPDILNVDKAEYEQYYDKRTEEVKIRLKKYDPNTVYAHFGDLSVRVTMPEEIYDTVVAPKTNDKGILDLLFAMRVVKNIMGQCATSFNPNFVLSNPVRDLSMKFLVDVSNAEEVKKPLLSLLQIPKTIKTIMDWNKGIDNAGTRLYQEYLNNGGKTSFTNVFKIGDMLKSVEQDFAEAAKKKNVATAIKDFPANTLKFIQVSNDIFESMTRFQAYKDALADGKTPAQAAHHALDITLNFNRHGEYGNVLNTLYLFGNASLQGGAAVARTVKSLAKTPQGRRTLAVLVAAGVVGALLGKGLSGEDDDKRLYYDKITDWVKDNNWILMLPNSDKYITIPMPHGFSIIPNLGRYFVELAYGDKTLGDVTTSTLTNVMETANPLGSDARWWANLIPTILRPFTDVGSNTKFTGRHIKPIAVDKSTPANKLFYADTSAVFIAITKWLNAVSGGDEYRAGYLDFSPADIQHIFESYTGGVGKSLARGADAFQQVAKGKRPKFNNVPVLRRFLAESNDFTAIDDYYNLQKEIKILNKAKKSRNMAWLALPDNRKKLKAAAAVERYVKLVNELTAQSRKAKTDELKEKINKLVIKYKKKAVALWRQRI